MCAFRILVWIVQIDYDKWFQLKLKVGLSASGLFFISCNESPLKMMKNAFYFMSKTLFVLEIFKFFSSLFGNAQKLPVKKA